MKFRMELILFQAEPPANRPGLFPGRRSVLTLLLLVSFTKTSVAQTAGSGIDTNPEIITVTSSQTFVRRGPSATSPRAGVVKKGARMSVVGRVRGIGCIGDWLKLAVGGYICSEETTLTREKPGGPRHPVMEPRKRLPFRYIIMGAHGGHEYANIEDALADLPIAFLERGFGRTYERVIRINGLRFYLTTRQTLIPVEEAFRVKGSDLSGIELREKGSMQLPVVFIYQDRTPVYNSPGGRIVKRVERFRTFMADKMKVGKRRNRYIRIPPHGFVRANDVRLAVRTSPPIETGLNGKWVDLDISEQVLVAYEGETPVYAALMSSGRGNRTPTGVFRVWAKLAATDMSNDPEAERHYSLWNVPWTLFYHRGYGIHGTYWHNRFGHRRSYGCINLSPRDAKWIFDWSSPELHPGWWARLPARNEDSLVVRVRKSTPEEKWKSFEVPIPPKRSVHDLPVKVRPRSISIHP